MMETRKWKERFCKKPWKRLMRWFSEGRIGPALLVVSLVIFVVFIYVVFWVPTDCKDYEWICDRFGVEGAGSKEKIVGRLGLGLVAFLTIWVASRRAIAVEIQAKAQADEARAQLAAVRESEKSRIQERHRHAVDQLGHESESVRLGGAYELFHLALEEEDLRQSIAERLCAYIREVTGREGYKQEYKNHPSTEIQSLMELLFTWWLNAEKIPDLKRFWRNIRPDLSGGYFRGIQLVWPQFQSGNFESAQFQGAGLRDAQFQEARLLGAQFQGARLANSQFQGAYIFQAQFQKAGLEFTQFQGAQIWQTQFQGADLHGTQLQGADLYEAHFQEAVFNETNFQGGCNPIGDFLTNFEKRIKYRIERPTELSGVVFFGGLTPEEIDDIANQLEGLMEASEIASFKASLERHIGDPRSEIPEGVETGSYSEEEAEKWIAEHKQAMNWAKGSNQD